MILLAGSGRNVGKTWLAERFISSLSKDEVVWGVKISSHMHALNEDVEVIAGDNVNWLIGLEQNRYSKKDSGRLLRAGAEKVIYAQIKDDHFLGEVVSWLKDHVSDSQLVVCESAALGDFVQPGCAFFVSDDKVGKTCRWNFPYVRVASRNEKLVNPPQVQWKDNKWNIL